MLKHISTYHPKFSVPPTRRCVEAVLSRPGWIAQPKIDGWRAQVHVLETRVTAFTRTGNPLPLPRAVTESLMALLAPGTVVEGEWVARVQTLYLFDVVALDGKVLRDLTYAERYRLLPAGNERIRPLTVLKEPVEVMALLEGASSLIEGVVFRFTTGKGFSDADIQRCRKRGHRHSQYG